jgi:hypothetical protein
MPSNRAKRETKAESLLGTQIDAPDIFVLFGEPDLVEGNSHLHGPALAVDGRFPVPDAVPGFVRIDIVGQGRVRDRIGRVDAEGVAGPLVIIGVDGEKEPIRVDLGVAPAQTADDFRGIGIPAESGHVDRLVVVGHPDIGFFGGRLAVLGIALGESVRAFPLPNGLVEKSVDHDGFGRPDGLNDLLVGLGFGEIRFVFGRKQDRAEDQENRYDQAFHLLSFFLYILSRDRLFAPRFRSVRAVLPSNTKADRPRLRHRAREVIMPIRKIRQSHLICASSEPFFVKWGNFYRIRPFCLLTGRFRDFRGPYPRLRMLNIFTPFAEIDNLRTSASISDNNVRYRTVLPDKPSLKNP